MFGTLKQNLLENVMFCQLALLDVAQRNILEWGRFSGRSVHLFICPSVYIFFLSHEDHCCPRRSKALSCTDLKGHRNFFLCSLHHQEDTSSLNKPKSPNMMVADPLCAPPTFTKTEKILQSCRSRCSTAMQNHVFT